MDFSEMLNYILYIVLTLILPVIAKYAIDYIKARIEESSIITDATHNDILDQIIKGALSDVMDAVLYVNQTYTDSLKSHGCFDKEAQKEAFNRAYTEAVNLISEETKNIIEQLYGSFDKWLKLKIESCVNISKTAKKQ